MRDVHVGLHGCSPFRDATAAAAAATPCPGGWSFVPVHWQEVEGRGAGRRLSEPHKVLHVEFFHPAAATDHEAMDTGGDADAGAYLFGEGCFETDVPVTCTGDVAGVLCWWNTFLLSPSLDPSRDLAISTEPGARPWQDHWLQVVFPLPASLPCAAGDVVRVTVAHDAVRMWLAAAKKHGRPDPPLLAAASPVPVERRLRPAQCSCGWHLLCGPERMQGLNDVRKKALWERATAELLDALDGAVGASTSIPVVADVGDGSLLSLGLAAALRARLRAPNSAGGTALSALRVVSAEKKQFSRLLHWALVEANGLDDLMYVWDGDDWGDVAAYHGPDPDDNGGASMPAPTCAVRAVICEPAFYQLHALPTWQAVAVHYKLRALAVAQVLRADALVAPRRAWVMAAAFELTDLAGSFGAVGTVCGLDHGALDRRQEAWHTHTFPLKLQAYRKRMLTEPVAIATIDYTSLTVLEDLAASTATTTTTITAPVVRAGRGDCVVVWVDYDLRPARLGCPSSDSDGSDLTLRHWAHHAPGSVEPDFPAYYKASVKFFPQPVRVDPATAPATLTATVAMELGASDFSYAFGLH
jgi:hypothetical protein